MKKKLLRFLRLILLVLILVFTYFFVGKSPQAEKIIWGVNFSQKQAQGLGLDWKKSYLALLEDLNVKNIKIAGHWDLVEPQKDEYNLEDLDWQIKEAEKNEAKIMLALGIKTPRWPECHIPEWALSFSKEDQQKEILSMLNTVVSRYGDSSVIKYWQVENEPFFPFGECPWADKDFLKREVALVRSLDAKNRPIIITDSGEGSFWISAGKIGDIVGTTMYKKVWISQFKIYATYPFPAVFYWRKAEIVKKIFGKKVIVAELQAEPWGPKPLSDSSILEQEKSMDLKRFKQNIEFAKSTGFDEFYLWGAEWWYWMKEKQERPEIWEEAKNLFRE